MEVIGHRGAAGLAPENTISSFDKALACGVDTIEFDVSSPKSGSCVLSHDPVPGAAGLLKLETALDYLYQKAPVILDLKPGVDIKALCEILRNALSAGWPQSSLLVASRDFKTLQSVREALPMLPIAVEEKYFGWRARSRAKKLKTKRLHLPAWNLWAGYIAAVSRSGWEVYAYTVNEPKKARRWAKYGLKGIFTDYPDRFTK